MTADFRTAPIDEPAAAILRAQGLELRLVDTDDHAAVERYVQAETRGFHGGIMSPATLDAHVAEFVAHRRLSAVYDPAGVDPLTPIATSNSWIGALTLPGERDIDAWAISGVTTAQTHRRRGIQRQIMEAELRTAHRLGVPAAMLTVSESSIYGRYGFGIVALAAEYRIDTRGLSWTGPEPSGRLDFIPVTGWRELVPGLFEQVRRRDPGQVEPFALRWDQIAGIAANEGDKSGERRAVQYRDDEGELRGMALYTVTDDPDEFTNHRATVLSVVAATDDAYAAIWRFFVEMDLVGTVTYELGSVDERLRWMVSNFRAVVVKPFDMHYVRVLDAAAALGARAYGGAESITLEVVDDLDLTTGAWTVGPDGVAPAGGRSADLVLGVGALSAAVGGMTGALIHGLPGLVERRPGALATAADLFRTRRTPYLSSWY